ncbi:C40 family peptidase [Streptomyces physcomitrii]|uniref:C40 family peptidase n=1 Tax=Streptomyces physcomitrii TaxID=2724184 RepID=A0ABX1H9I1_9ACTN|nr:C40 family peptidase [Streptomyces physcomitrii]NKI45057.1 C40 family peptidase [Streptomyces physcomitrii]
MSHSAHIRSHRKPRRSQSKLALRAGVAGGFLSTLAVAGAAGPANAAEPATETIELPTLTEGLSTQTAESAAQIQQAADTYELQATRETATERAVKQAKKDQAAAERKAEEAKKKAAEEAKEKAARAAEQRANRSSARTALTPVATPSSGSVSTVISFLKAQLGKPYVMGGTGPSSWDCSGLVQAAFQQAGVSLPRTSQEQSTAGTQVSVSSAQAGDILYWGGAGSAHHVGVYLGNGQYLDAANPSKGVVIQDLSGYPASGAIRVL